MKYQVSLHYEIHDRHEWIATDKLLFAAVDGVQPDTGGGMYTADGELVDGVGQRDLMWDLGGQELTAEQTLAVVAVALKQNLVFSLHVRAA